MKPRVVLPLLGTLLLGSLVLGCIQQAKDTAECSGAGDCAGRAHDACAGSWGCLDGKCAWECETTTIPASKGGEGEFCGGIAGVMCQDNLRCRLDGNDRDAGGVCVKAECDTDSDCAAGGCSGEVCATKDATGKFMSICIMRSEYECLKLTSCGCVEGKCAFKTTPEYTSCWNKATGQN